MDRYLASLVDNLSEINNKDCKKCMERNKIKSECCYINHKYNRLIYKYDGISYKPIHKLIKRFPNINSVTKILVNSYYY